MKLYVGMDLHSTNVVTQIINEEDSVVYRATHLTRDIY